MSADRKRPNILLIMPDQMRGDCLGLEGHPSLLTPNMDEIGAKGAHFRRAYTTCASCIPARRSLLTGQFPATNGMVGFQGGCRITSPTLPALLRDAGYHTAICGRYMHQYPYQEGYGYETRVLGSTYMSGDSYQARLGREAPGSGGIKGHGISFNGWQAKPWHLPEHLHPTNWVVQSSRELLQQHDDNSPLFLTSSFYAPHPPLIPPSFYMERYLRAENPDPVIGDWAQPPANGGIGAGVDAHRTVLRGEALRSAQAGYYGLINHLDDQIYWLTREFQSASTGAGRPWIIVVTSDHGEMLADHYYFRKCEPYEGSSRIPLLIRGSSEFGFEPGVQCDRPVCLEDIMPTLLELGGMDVPEGVDGQSLAPVLRGEAGGVRESLHAEHSPCYSRRQAYHMLTDGRYKYIWRPVEGTEQLFDLQEDPGEVEDLAGKDGCGEVLTGLREALIERLRNRAEGFTDGERLIAGRPYEAILDKSE